MSRPSGTSVSTFARNFLNSTVRCLRCRLDISNPSVLCGLSSNAFQIRPLVDLDRPLRSAILARDQGVAFLGVDSSVATTTSSTCLSVTVAGRPDRGSSTRPSRRNSTNRARHLPTVGADTPSAAATSLLLRPDAHPSTIRDRRASACEDERRRDHRVSCSRSSEVSARGTLGLPNKGILHSSTYSTKLRRRTLDE